MIDIYRDINGTETVVRQLADDNASVVDEIMGRQEVSIDITVDGPLDTRVGDYVRVDGVTYTLNREVTLEKRSDVEYRYVMVFESPLYRLLDKILTHPITGVSSFTISRTLREWLRIVVDCVNTIDPGWTVAANIPDTDPRNILLEDTSCREALSRLAGEFGMEYYLSGREVCLIDRIENATGLVFEQGRGKGLYTVTREPVDTENTVTRLYPYGGTANMAPGEGDANGRLYLPERYLENFSEYGKVVEKVVVFEDIFPCFRGTVRSVSGDYNRVITCPEIDFNITDWLVGGVTAKINFLSGDLMGESFELNWDNDRKQIDLVRKEDGTALPDKDGKRPLIPHELRKAEVGNTFNLTDITMPPPYKDTAVALLRKKATDWLSYRSRLRVRFSLEVDHRYLRGRRALTAGDLVTVKIPEAGVDRLLRVNSVERNLKTGKMSCTVSNYLDEKWEKKIEGVISDLKNTVSGGSGGGATGVEIIEEHDETEPTNRNVYAAKRTDREIRESEERAEGKFLRKDIPDTSQGKITFADGLELGAFNHDPDPTIGTGGRIEADGTAELQDLLLREGLDIGAFIPGLLGCGIRLRDGRIEADEMYLRKRLTVPELVYSKVKVVGNEMWVTEGGEVGEVIPDQDSSDNLYWIRLKDTDKNRPCGFWEDDILRGIVHVRDGEGRFQGFHTVMCRVVTIAEDQAFSVIPQEAGMVPVEGLVFARQGNLTNPDRQRSIYLSSELGCIRFLNDVDGYDILPRMISMQLGTTEGAVIPGLEDLPGYNAILNNVVARGSFVQISGDKVTERPIPCFKGEWKAGKYYYYDEVTKNGCKYLCIAKTTGQQPAYDSTDWLMTEGNNKFSVSLESSMGYEFPAGALDTMLTARVFAGNEEITGMIASSFVKWTRKSGDTDSDTGWNALHEGAGTTIPLTPADIPTSRPDLMVFECEITIVYNDKVHKQSDKIII